MDNSTTTNNGATAPTDPEAAELRALMAKRARLAEEREARHSLSTAEQLVVAKRALEADEALAKAEEQYGKRAVGIVRVDDERDGRAIIVKRPNMTMFKRWIDAPKEDKGKEVEKLVRPSRLYPDAEAFDALVEELPFLMTRCADMCITLAGVRKNDVEEK
jgi:hypothetical protein